MVIHVLVMLVAGMMRVSVGCRYIHVRHSLINQEIAPPMGGRSPEAVARPVVWLVWRAKRLRGSDERASLQLAFWIEPTDGGFYIGCSGRASIGV
jgi:hypothetical protein